MAAFPKCEASDLFNLDLILGRGWRWPSASVRAG